MTEETTTIALRMPKQLLKWVDEKAEREFRTRTSVINDLVAQHIKKEV